MSGSGSEYLVLVGESTSDIAHEVEPVWTHEAQHTVCWRVPLVPSRPSPYAETQERCRRVLLLACADSFSLNYMYLSHYQTISPAGKSQVRRFPLHHELHHQLFWSFSCGSLEIAANNSTCHSAWRPIPLHPHAAR
jgi:hypothetical protein